MTTKPPDGFVLVERTGVVVRAALGIIALMGLMYGGMLWWFMRPIRAEAQVREAADLAILAKVEANDQRISRLIRIAELQATFTLEPPGSPEREKALYEFRQMRKLIP